MDDHTNLTNDELLDRITTAYATMQHHKAQFLLALAVFDARELARLAGAPTTADWMTRALDIAPTTAYDYLRVARLLLEFAYVAKSFEDGKITYSTVRLLSSYLNKDNEIELLLLAEEYSYRELERILMTRRDNRNNDAPRENTFKIWVDKHNGRIRFSGDLDPMLGAKFMAALKIGELANLVDLDDIDPEVFSDDERLGEELAKAEAEALAAEDGAESVPVAEVIDADGEEGEASGAATDDAATGDTDGADADGDGDSETRRVASVSGYGRTSASQLLPALLGLINIARSSPVNKRRAPGTQVHLIQTEDGQSILPGLPVPSEKALSAEVINGELRDHFLDTQGVPLMMTTKRRFVSDAQALAILVRWGMQCAAPGCRHTQFMEFHHVHPWSMGGKTKPDNMAPLCGFCHALVTAGLLELVPAGSGVWLFRYRTGEVYASKARRLPMKQLGEASCLDEPVEVPTVVEVLEDGSLSFDDSDTINAD